MEFAGPGIKNLPIDFRNGIDVMTTETTCLSSIWETDDEVREYYVNHGRPQDYKEVKPADVAYYDSVIELNLDEAECMIALPFHPSNAYSIKEFRQNAGDILAEIDKKGAEQFGKKVHFNLSERSAERK